MTAEVATYVTCRDRLTCLQTLVGWLESGGRERVVLIDCASTYEPLLEWLETQPYPVLRAPNLGPRAYWLLHQHLSNTSVADSRAEPVVITDCDTCPEADPAATYQILCDTLALAPTWVTKVGLALRTDDIPSHFPWRKEVQWQQARLEVNAVTEPRALPAPTAWGAVDTTFAIYRAASDPAPDYARNWRVLSPRARHSSWYLDPSALPPDELHYLTHLEHWTDWSRQLAARAGVTQ